MKNVPYGEGRKYRDEDVVDEEVERASRSGERGFAMHGHCHSLETTEKLEAGAGADLRL